VVEHGAAACAGGSCSIQSCASGYRDCNFDVSDGCDAKGSKTLVCE
jgi:hypothetical protein